MGEIEDWKVQINDEVMGNNGPSSEKEQWKRPSIYKVSSRITELNKNAYEPEVVSFGPYHHGKDHLKAMEDHKQRALIRFLRRCKKDIKFVFERMEQVAQDLKASYKPLDPIWADDTPRFLKLLILDGYFMLEIMRDSDSVLDDYADNDPVFSEHGKLNVMPYIKRDMLLLENQLPMLVLRTLNEAGSDMPQEHDVLNKQILEFLSHPTDETEPKDKCVQLSPTNAETKPMDKCVHVLDLYKKNLSREVPSHPCICNSDCFGGFFEKKEPKHSGCFGCFFEKKEPKKEPKHSGCFGRFFGKKEPKHSAADEIIRSATELHEAGMCFQKSKTQSLRDITFNNARGILKLPLMVVDDTTESKLLNIIAFERLHVGASNEVTSYVYFMNTIIDDEKDVALLHRRGILIKALGCHNDIAKLFNSLAKDITPDQQRESHLAQITAKLSKYCRMSCRRWRASLRHTYCRNPWVATSVIAAILLFVLTMIQTWCSVVSYYDQHFKDGVGS